MVTVALAAGIVRAKYDIGDRVDHRLPLAAIAAILDVACRSGRSTF